MIPVIDRVLAQVERIPFSGCWIFMGTLNDAGYGIVGLGRRADGIDRVHRVVYRHFHGDIPAGFYVCHRCDTRPCCNPAHLWADTSRANRLDCLAKGRDVKPPRNRHLRGDRHYATRWTDEQIATMRARVAAGETNTAVAADYGMSIKYIGAVIARRKRP